MSVISLANIVDHFPRFRTARPAFASTPRGQASARTREESRRRRAQETQPEEPAPLLFIGLVATLYVIVRMSLTYLVT